MAMSFGIALCIAYLAGLLLSPVSTPALFGVGPLPWLSLIGCSLVVLWGAIAPRRVKLGWRFSQWLGLAAVILLGTMYITVRSPSAGAFDISHFVERAQTISPTQVITGRLIEDPSLNRDLKGRFRVAVTTLEALQPNGEATFRIPVQGRVYVTAPLLQVTGLHAGQLIKAKGQIYLPQAAMNPNGFDFRATLTQQGTFAGLVATELKFNHSARWGLWRIRQRVVQAQLRALGSPLGQLVSAMALGRKAVDLPANIQDLFSRVGLAHTIAASGFHVSLLLGSVLALMRSRPEREKVIAGAGVLLVYVTLTGLQPSVVRAALMGAAALAGLATNRKVIPSGALLAAVTLMLLINPLWVWNIGFQLSVVATWGLIATVPTISRWLNWLPLTLASFIAVPTAATVWTIPLMLYHFNVVSGLGIGLNVVATPLVTLISLGGIGSSALALLLPSLGELAAKPLYYPAQGLLWLAQTSSELPGSSIAIGQISIWQLLGLYAVLLIGLLPQFKGRPLVKPLLPLIFVALVLTPIGWRWLTQDQVTILAAGEDLIWVRQVHGQTTLVNSGGEKTAFYSVEPFLKQAGVNRVETAIALPFKEDYLAGWQTLFQQIPGTHLYSLHEEPTLVASVRDWQGLRPGHSATLGSLTAQLLGTDNAILRLTASHHSWLLLPTLSSELQDYLAQNSSVLRSDVLVWDGELLSPALLAAVSPKTVICYGPTLSEAIERSLRQQDIQVFWTNRDGAVTWQARHGFQGYLARKHRNAQPLG